jgi:hypothetical protein
MCYFPVLRPALHMFAISLFQLFSLTANAGPVTVTVDKEQ